jgi:hypothetical protein
VKAGAQGLLFRKILRLRNLGDKTVGEVDITVQPLYSNHLYKTKILVASERCLLNRD